MTKTATVFALLFAVLAGCGDESNEHPTDPCEADTDAPACTESVCFGTGYEVGVSDTETDRREVYDRGFAAGTEACQGRPLNLHRWCEEQLQAADWCLEEIEVCLSPDNCVRHHVLINCYALERQQEAEHGQDDTP
ncbi:MAG: hypothetical protein AAGF92_17715 [Myxococcota bacterium]